MSRVLPPPPEFFMRNRKSTKTLRMLAVALAFAATAVFAAYAQTAGSAAPPAEKPAATAPASEPATAESKPSTSAGKPADATAATPKESAPVEAGSAKPTTTIVVNSAPAISKPSKSSAGANNPTENESALTIPPAGNPTAAEVASITPSSTYIPGKTMPGVKPGSEADVNAVGHRPMGGRGLGNWYSESTAIKIGASYAQQIDKSSKIITDPIIANYINRIGQNIVKNSDCKVPFTIKVIDSPEINAFALPGGFFFVYSGLILAANSEAELAAVMAHETAHVCANSALREMTRQNYAQIASLAAMIMTGGSMLGYGIYELSGVAIPVVFLKFSREMEAQADYLGIQYMYRAGYDPEAMISFFEKIEDLQKHKPGAVSKFFDTHPPTPDRIRASQEEIATILPPRAEYLENTSEFELVKARLARMESRQRLQFNKKNLNRPSLRRVNNNPNNPNSEEPPTLHRPDEPNSANTTN